MKAIYDEHKKVYRVNNADGTFDTYTPEQYRALSHSEVVEEEDTTTEEETQTDEQVNVQVNVQVDESQVASYKLLQEIPYTDEHGVEQGKAEAGSIQEVPTELGDVWVEQGMAEKVVAGQSATDETITTETNPQS